MKRILVVGASSFIGGHLWAKLLDEDPELLVGTFCANRPELPQKSFSCLIPLDITDEANVEHLLGYYEFDIIFHLGAISRVMDDSSRVTRVNVLGTHNLLRNARNCRFVFASSATVYGPGDTECSFNEGDPLSPRSAYAASKVGAEALVEAYGHLGLVKPLVIRLVANVGPGATHGVVPDLIRKALSSSPTLEVLGTSPGSRKPYLHVSDTTSLMIKAAATNLDLINFSNRGLLSSRDIARMVLEKTGVHKSIVWDRKGNWAGDDRFVNVSSELMDSYFDKNLPTSRLAVEKAIEELL